MPLAPSSGIVIFLAMINHNTHLDLLSLGYGRMSNFPSLCIQNKSLMGSAEMKA